MASKWVRRAPSVAQWRWFMVGLGLLAALHVGDGWSTAILLARGYREANPLALHTSLGGFALWKMVGVSAQIIAFQCFWRITGYYRLTLALLGLGLGLLLVTTLHNWLYVLGS